MTVDLINHDRRGSKYRSADFMGPAGKSGELTNVNFWVARQQSLAPLPEGGICPAWHKHVSRFLPRRPRARCLEVGVVPGAYLLFLASEYKYLCTGVDLSPKIKDVSEAFSEQKVPARFIQTDFLSWQSEEKFDLVYSCGFIEHFSDYQSLIKRHWELVRPGGLMLLTVPTLTPVQQFIRLITYEHSKMQEILNTHNLSIMNLKRLCYCVGRCSGSEILYSSYIREMTVWFGVEDPGVRGWTKPLFWPIRLLERLAQRMEVSSRWFSPEALVLARKIS